ncbi:hypothetical protein IW261DRAFT_1605100 [Armillaria novae-zelandiae]|uniref:Uncharacterized protein n=1 Tax=Armillaria novae-zelandiae TaxID=153914 RepID=A0AA39PKJ4_9AGAR|nr:hypothetical protein IW261DRAFT_1605100 [Armillaria novae-zelandiae]
MLSLPLVLLSLHALAVYSAPAKDSDDVAVLRRGGMIHGLTLRREEYHQLQKRTSICGVQARDASNRDCTKTYPSGLTKRIDKRKGGRGSRGSSSSGGSSSGQDGSHYTDQTSSTQQREDVEYDQEMEDAEDAENAALGNHCDHLVELQVVEAALYNYCNQIRSSKISDIKNYLNNARHNLYLINGRVNLAKGAATKRAMLIMNDGRSRTYQSAFDQSVWIGVVKYLNSKKTVADTNAKWIEDKTGLTGSQIGDSIYAIYDETLQIAKEMRDSFLSPSQQTDPGSQGSGGSSPGSQGSGSSSGISDLPAERTVTYKGRPLKLYLDKDNEWYYAFSPDGQNYRYEWYDATNLLHYPPF